MRYLFNGLLFLLSVTSASAVWADTAPFDLAGPTLRVTVSRNGESLPIAEVPQLAAGDRIAVRADLPADQSSHYLLIAAFLRGSTNPPPDSWFFKSEPWKKRDRNGLVLTVPADAAQVVLFLAPETGGDFPTLRDAVQGRPGAFVRAAQELAQASLDHARLQAYLDAVRKTVPGDPERLSRITPLLARSLQIKVNSDCLEKMPSLQAPCLLQNQESLVLNDGHSNAITDALQGPGTDLALQLSATPQGGLGYYGPYIAAIRDVVGILSSLHTAKYQYLPALATVDGDGMGLVLNAAPSFHNPKSVLVAALPIIAPTHIPPLQIPDTDPSICLQDPRPLLPIAGAPLIYATRYAHDLSLHVQLPQGRTIELPATPDVERGGLALDLGGMPKDIAGPLVAQLHGAWGFQSFDGPAVTLQTAGTGGWRPASGDRPVLGGSVALTGGSSACVSGVVAQSQGTAPPKLAWTRTSLDGISVTLPAEARSKPFTLAVDQVGAAPQTITLGSPKPPSHLNVAIIARNIQTADPGSTLPIILTSDAEVPSSATLTFSLQLDASVRWTGKERVEIGVEHGYDPGRLAAPSGLTFLDDGVAIARVQPSKLLGVSAFGALRARVIGKGAISDWLPLGTLVRTPKLAKLNCPSATGACQLSGEGLYLIRSVAVSPAFDKPVDVPTGYAAPTLEVAHPIDGNLYLRLHDAPDIVNRIAAGDR